MIEQVEENGVIASTFKNMKECSWEVFGDERQIALAIKYEKMAYGYYWREI